MEGCRSSSGSGFSNFCWMSGYDDGYYERCGGNSECRAAVKAGGSCKAFSCAFFRAPNPFTSHEKTCSYKIAKTLRNLQNECNAEGATFDSWAQAYRTSGDLYRKFEPCTGHFIEEETKIKRWSTSVTATTSVELGRFTMAVRLMDLKADWIRAPTCFLLTEQCMLIDFCLIVYVFYFILYFLDLS